MKYTAIIPAAGQGTRSGLEYNKVFYPLGDTTVLQAALKPFEQDPDCTQILVTCSEADWQHMGRLLSPKARLVRGGADRAHSVYQALKEAEQPLVFIHDGARPWLRAELLKALKEKMETAPGAFLAIPVRDSLKKVENGRIQSVDRTLYWQAQTPQAFDRDQLIEAYEQAFERDLSVTDDAQVFEAAGGLLEIVNGDPNNRKITDPQDLEFCYRT